MFPENSGFVVYPGVFFGYSELSHDRELQRTRPGFVETGNGGRFVIKQPLVGIRYVVYWAAPSKAESHS